MNQILSQSEVDALLNAVNEGGDVPAAGDTGGGPGEIPTDGSVNGDPFSAAMDAGAVAAAPEVEVQPYDLTNQDRVIRGRMPTLDIIYERFIRAYRISLSNSLRKIASISIISTDLLKFGEFVNTLPIPSCMCIMRFESLRGAALLVFESKLAYALVDSYFGGTDRPFTKVEGKEFTRIELSIMQKVMNLSIKDLEDAWEPVHKTNIQFSRIEVNPQFVGVVPPSDVIISTTFEVELENASGTIALVIPYSTIEPIKHKLSASFQTEADRLEQARISEMEEHLRQAFAEVTVNLGQASIMVNDLINLQIGDTIPLSQNADSELEVLVENVPKYKCFFGVSRGNRAIQITRAIQED